MHNDIDLKKHIRSIPDFPKPGILFYDITTLLQDAEGFRLAVDSAKAALDRSEAALRDAEAGAPAGPAILPLALWKTLRDSRAAGLRAMQAMAESYSAMVGGVLLGMSEALQQKPAAKRGK